MGYFENVVSVKKSDEIEITNFSLKDFVALISLMDSDFAVERRGDKLYLKKEKD
jgi:hypothetical protein